MKIVDTVVLIGSILKDKHHDRAFNHLLPLKNRKEVYIPSSTLLEFDLILKNRGYTTEERKITFDAVMPYISERKVLPITPAIISQIPDLEPKLSYFDAFIVAYALNLKATVITTDAEISKWAEVEW